MGKIAAIDDVSDTLCSVVDWLSVVASTSPSPQDAADADAANNALMTYLYHLNTHAGLHALLDSVTSSPDTLHTLPPGAVRTATLLADEFERHGVRLDPDQSAQLKVLLNKGFALSSAFTSAATKCSQAGDPSRCLETVLHSPDPAARADAAARFHSLLPDNVSVLEDLLDNRHASAVLLGKKSHAHFTGEERMVADPEVARNRLHVLAAQAAQGAQENIRHLLQLKLDAEGPSEITDQLSRAGSNATLPYADRIHYAAVRRAAHISNHDLEPISPYLSLRSGLAGVALAAREVFGIRLVPAVPKPGETVHSSVLKYEVRTEDNGFIGTIFVDPWPRPGKSTGAVHLNITSGRALGEAQVSDTLPPGRKGRNGAYLGLDEPSDPESYQAPSVVLVYNFRHRSVDSDLGSSLLSLHEMETLFHEFGHGLHSMLARTQFHHVAGTRVPLDFVELPSSFFEKYATSWPVLSQVCTHYKTNARLPQDLLDAHLELANVNAPLTQVDQVELALIDTELHTAHANHPDAVTTPGWSTKLVNSVLRTHSPIIHPDNSLNHARFHHLITYGSSYYSYSLCKDLADQAWDVLGMEDDPLNRAAGERFAYSVLVHGNAKPPLDQIHDLGLSIS